MKLFPLWDYQFFPAANRAVIIFISIRPTIYHLAFHGIINWSIQNPCQKFFPQAWIPCTGFRCLTTLLPNIKSWVDTHMSSSGVFSLRSGVFTRQIVSVEEGDYLDWLGVHRHSKNITGKWQVEASRPHSLANTPTIQLSELHKWRVGSIHGFGWLLRGQGAWSWLFSSTHSFS